MPRPARRSRAPTSRSRAPRPPQPRSRPAAARRCRCGPAAPTGPAVAHGASWRDAVAATVQRFGGLDILMYGAADSDQAATVLEMDEAAWDRVVRINLTGAFLMVKAAIPAMIARGGGSIIMIASQLG